MAQDFDFRINGRMLEWRTKAPFYCGCSVDSPTFKLLESEWYLKFSRSTHIHVPPSYDRFVSLIPKLSEAEQEAQLQRRIPQLLQTPFRVSTYIEHPTDPSRPPTFWETHPSRPPISWKSYLIIERKKVKVWKTTAIGFENDSIDSVGEVRIVCLFCGVEPSPSGHSVKMSVYNKNVTPESVDKCVQVSQEVPRDIETLSSDISGLLRDGILPDFKLKCDGQIFKVHRSILAARSEVFRAMLENKMLESETGSADIKDLDVPILESLIKFVYSGKLDDISEDTASKLFEAADKYAVRSLSTACSYWMIRNLTVVNCTNYLKTADLHSDPELKAAAVSLILAHPGMFKSPAWLTFLKEHVVLASEVLQAFAASIVSPQSNDEQGVANRKRARNQ